MATYYFVLTLEDKKKSFSRRVKNFRPKDFELDIKVESRVETGEWDHNVHLRRDEDLMGPPDGPKTFRDVIASLVHEKSGDQR